jgi:hypothetical protein
MQQVDVEALSYSVLDEHDNCLYTTDLKSCGGTTSCQHGAAAAAAGGSEGHNNNGAAGKDVATAAVPPAAVESDFGRRGNETHKE